MKIKKLFEDIAYPTEAELALPVSDLIEPEWSNKPEIYQGTTKKIAADLAQKIWTAK